MPWRPIRFFAPAGGVEIYQSPVCDEEYLRWCARLFRHYAFGGGAVSGYR
ncbi:MAG: hypothetical protein CM1200mP2_13280 [Planctomycetaceae bacterium]|nr:MAG: hypothetical protein CM1200mP2_13280 [Planctomycetaceae bacterium]